jgi:pimeloyl-ACP methyl ester carboxylesterase
MCEGDSVTSFAEFSHTVTVAGRSIACASHDPGSAAIVLFCHGFRGEKTGPNRTFVRAARRLAARGIGSLRFDQYGSGDSAGEFIESRFDDWVATIRVLANEQVERGCRVALFGQSMGASAAICAAAGIPVEAVVAWVPDASTDDFSPDPRGFVEEGGQRVSNDFWRQAHRAAIPEQLVDVSARCYFVFGTADEYVSEQNRSAVITQMKPFDRVDVFDGYPHSAWTFEQAEDIIQRSTNFLEEHLLV